MRREFLCVLLLLLGIAACDRASERKPLTGPHEPSEKVVNQKAMERRRQRFERYDGYLRAKIDKFPGVGASAGALDAALARARPPVLAALGIPAVAPVTTVKKVWEKRLPHARVEAWRVSGPGDAADLPALLWLPPDSKPKSVVVLANGTGQNKHDFLSQLSCAAFVSAGAACISWDPLGEGERSHTPETRAREFLNDDMMAISTDIGRPLLGIQVSEIRRLISAVRADTRTGKLPLAVAGYSLGGWTALLTGLVDDRVDVLVAASTLVVPSQVPGLAAGGWRIPGLTRAIKLEEMLALNAHAHPTLWINGGKDNTFAPDETRRLELLSELASKARALLPAEQFARLQDVVVKRGPHLPYYLSPPGLKFLGEQGILPRAQEAGLLSREPEPLGLRLAEIARTTELKWWPRDLIEIPFAPAGLPLVPAKELFAGDGPYPLITEWMNARMLELRKKRQLPAAREARAEKVRRLLDADFDSLIDPARWKALDEIRWEDSWTGLRARWESGTGTGLLVYFPHARTLIDTVVPDEVRARAAKLLLVEPLSYSDNEAAAETTATGQTLAALLSLLKTQDFAAFESFEVYDGTGTLGAPLALIDARVAALELPVRPLTTVAPTRFQFEGHVPGFTSVHSLETILGALAPLPLRVAEGALLEEEREALVKSYAGSPDNLIFVP